MTAYIVIVRNKDFGYRFQLRQHLASAVPVMQSRREVKPAGARQAAEGVFGPLKWRTADEARLEGQPYVESVAVVEVAAGTW